MFPHLILVYSLDPYTRSSFCNVFNCLWERWDDPETILWNSWEQSQNNSHDIGTVGKMAQTPVLSNSCTTARSFAERLDQAAMFLFLSMGFPSFLGAYLITCLSDTPVIRYHGNIWGEGEIYDQY